jgi:hypothetical protein
MGNQGASGDGTRVMKEWFDAGLIGDVTEIYAWTNRPFGRRVSHGLLKKATYPKNSTGTCGWVLHHTKIM